MPLSAREIAARWLLFTAALTTFLHLVKADDNFTDIDWLNATQLQEMFEYENNTEQNSTEAADMLDVNVIAPLETFYVIETAVGENNRSSDIESPFEKLRQQRYYARIVIMAVLLHVALVGICITIYSLIFCKVRTLKKRRRAEAQRILQRLRNQQFQHVPNSMNCPCHGCTVSRQMLQGLILQHMQELVEC